MTRFDDAVAQAVQYLDDNHSLTTEEEERRQFRTAYTILIETLGVRSPAEGLIADLLSLLEEAVGLELFPDTGRVLDDLSARGIKLGIVLEGV